MITDDDIREMLHRRAADATISADAWRRVEARIAAAGSGGRDVGTPGGLERRTMILLATAAVLVLVVASLTLLSLDDDQKVRTGPADGGATTATSEHGPSTSDRSPSTTLGVPSSDPSRSTTTTDPPATSSTTAELPPAVRLTDDSKVTMVGIGPVEAGMSLDEASQASGLTFRLDPESFISGVPGEGCGYASVEGGPEELSFMVIDRLIARVDVTGGVFTTVSGMGIGSTEQEIQATYDGVAVSPHEYVSGGHYLSYRTPGDPTHMLLFETDGNVVTNFRSGLEHAVRAVEGCS